MKNHSRNLLYFFAATALIGGLLMVVSNILLVGSYDVYQTYTGARYSELVSHASRGLVLDGVLGFILYGGFVLIYAMITKNLPAPHTPLGDIERNALERHAERGRKVARAAVCVMIVGAVALLLCVIAFPISLVIFEGWDGLGAAILLMILGAGFGTVVALSGATAGIAALYRRLRLDRLAQSSEQ